MKDMTYQYFVARLKEGPVKKKGATIIPATEPRSMITSIEFKVNPRRPCFVSAYAIRRNGDKKPASAADISEAFDKLFFTSSQKEISREDLNAWLLGASAKSILEECNYFFPWSLAYYEMTGRMPQDDTFTPPEITPIGPMTQLSLF